MNLGYFVAVVFGSLTLCYVWDDYKKGKMTKKSFITIAVMEAIVVAVCLVSLIASFK